VRSVTPLLGLLAATLAVGCVVGTNLASSEDELKNVEKTGSTSQRWIYQGPLPRCSRALASSRR
jgi:hypothetical protein